MAFESLFNSPALETELVEQVATVIQSLFSDLCDRRFYLKLSNPENKFVELAWEKEFKDPGVFADFLFDSSFYRACILVKFVRDHYEVACLGFFSHSELAIWPDKICRGPFRAYEDPDMETRKMPSRETVCNAFDDLGSAVSAISKSSKTM